MLTKPPLFQVIRPLTAADVENYEAELSRLQGNILKSHGRKASAHIFMTFLVDKVTEVKAFLRALPITSAAEQKQQIVRFKESHTSELFVGLYLSAQGYKYLGARTAGFSAEFLAGMKAAGARLNDAPVDRWEPEFQRVIHAMVLLAHDDEPTLSAEVERLRAASAGIGEITVETGRVIRNKADDPIEHFGYVDGISQPLFFESDIRKLSMKHWDPSAGPNLVLVRDPLGASDQDCGTYFVFRKLEQNVRGFSEREQALADALGLSGADRERAGALVVGRFRSGTPIALTDHSGTGAMNDFAFPAMDAQGGKCPFASHIRKTNPRGDTVAMGGSLEAERTHRIARRGVTYGPRPEAGAVPPAAGLGLLFQCCQSDLVGQFEFIQSIWANKPDFVHARTGRDPIIGQSPDGTFPPASYPPVWNGSDRVLFDFHGFVTLKGGEYLFAPSISYVKTL